MLVHHFLEFYARNTPAQACLTQGEVSHSYGETDATANQLARGLLDLGVEKGQRVGVLGENSYEHLVLLMAASKIGAVTVPLNYRLAPAELAFVIADARTRVLLVLDGMESLLEALLEQLPADLTVMTRDYPDTLLWQDCASQFAASAPESKVDREDAFIQLYTSGTTGNPKGVVSSHFNIVSLTMMNNVGMTQRPDPGTAGIV